MRRSILILSIIVCQLGLTSVARPTKPYYTDDAYYWPTVDTVVPTEPMYDRNMREFIFIEDTTQYTDTIPVAMPSR